jgi:hypothetical protein
VTARDGAPLPGRPPAAWEPPPARGGPPDPDAPPGRYGSPDEDLLPERQVALIDLLDRLLNGGVVLTGDVVLSIADIDLVRISLRAVVVAVTRDDRWALTPPPSPEGAGVEGTAAAPLRGPR